MSHSLSPSLAKSTIFWRMWSVKGLPLTNNPPSWLTPACPAAVTIGQREFYISLFNGIFNFIWRGNVGKGNLVKPRNDEYTTFLSTFSAGELWIHILGGHLRHSARNFTVHNVLDILNFRKIKQWWAICGFYICGRNFCEFDDPTFEDQHLGTNSCGDICGFEGVKKFLLIKFILKVFSSF
jgi:hypothetical protein